MGTKGTLRSSSGMFLHLNDSNRSLALNFSSISFVNALNLIYYINFR
jgi:hypothetical protein